MKKGICCDKRPITWIRKENCTQQDVMFKCAEYISSVQSLSCVRFATPWTAACQASLATTNSWSLLKFIAWTIWTFVSKVMSLLLNMLSKFVMDFLPRSKSLLISWLKSPSAVIFWAEENKVCHCFHCFPIYLPWCDGTGCHDLSYSPPSLSSSGSLVLHFLP